MAEITVTDQSFDKDILQSKLPVLADFWAEWCMPCRMVGPILEELAKEYEGKLTVAKINVDQNSQTASQFGIMSIPSLLIFKEGKVVKTMIGAQNKENLKKGIDEVLSQ